MICVKYEIIPDAEGLLFRTRLSYSRSQFEVSATMMMQPLTHTLARIIWIAKNNLQDVRKELEDAASLD